MQMQTDSDKIQRSKGLNNIHKAQIQHQNNASNIRTQIHESNYQYP